MNGFKKSLEGSGWWTHIAAHLQHAPNNHPQLSVLKALVVCGGQTEPT